MKEQLVQALKSKYGADYQMHKANLDIYLNNPVGIGEHPQHFEEMDKLVELMTSARDKLEVLDKEYPDSIRLTE
jgi:hypothetical protein|tara:strand:- start:380 stop:601 length:222 start_codon:yes stop_codon:yes gene_type:complete